MYDIHLKLNSQFNSKTILDFFLSLYSIWNNLQNSMRGYQTKKDKKANSKLRTFLCNIKYQTKTLHNCSTLKHISQIIKLNNDVARLSVLSSLLVTSRENLFFKQKKNVHKS